MDRRTRVARVVLCAAAAILAMTVAADAAVWRWGCSGRLGNEWIAFDREMLRIYPGKAAPGALNDFVLEGAFLPAAKAAKSGRTEPVPRVTYLSDDNNGGLVGKIDFTGANKERLTLVEVTSKTVSKKERLAFGCRDESHVRYRKVYRIEQPGQPPGQIDMQCINYTLSTRGGRTCR